MKSECKHSHHLLDLTMCRAHVWNLKLFPRGEAYLKIIVIISCSLSIIVTFFALATYLFQRVVTTTRRGQEELISDPCDHFLYSFRMSASQKQQVNHMFAIRHAFMFACLLFVLVTAEHKRGCALLLLTHRRSSSFFSLEVSSLLSSPSDMRPSDPFSFVPFPVLALSYLLVSVHTQRQKKRVCSTTDSG